MNAEDRIVQLEKALDLLASFVGQMAVGRVDPVRFTNTFSNTIETHGNAVPLNTFLEAVRIYQEDSHG